MGVVIDIFVKYPGVKLEFCSLTCIHTCVPVRGACEPSQGHYVPIAQEVGALLKTHWAAWPRTALYALSDDIPDIAFGVWELAIATRVIVGSYRRTRPRHRRWPLGAAVCCISQWRSFKFDPWDTKFPGSGTEIIPGKHSDTRIKPLPLTNGHGRYTTVTTERTLVSVGE
jgi:hypothetical protein